MRTRDRESGLFHVAAYWLNGWFCRNDLFANMAHKRKGQLTVSGQWAKHLRKFLRRKFWKGERKAGKKLIRNELNSESLRNCGGFFSFRPLSGRQDAPFYGMLLTLSMLKSSAARNSPTRSPAPIDLKELRKPIQERIDTT